MQGEPGRRTKRQTSRSKQVLDFWESRLGKKLTSREALEMQSNVEGLFGLLAQWDRADHDAGPRKRHDAKKG